MKNNTSSILISFIAGAAAGVAVGMLLAPDRGSETRKKLKNKVLDLEKDLETNVEKKFSDLKGYINKIVDSSTSSWNKSVSKVQSEANDFAENAKY